MQQVIIDIGKKPGEALGLTGFSVEGWPALFRINKYRFTPETIGSSGLQIHTDTGFFTIVQDGDSYGGLEVMDLSGTFRPPDPWPGTFLVVVGDVGAVSTHFFLADWLFQDKVVTGICILSCGPTGQLLLEYNSFIGNT